MWGKLKSSVHEVLQAAPGRRFRERYRSCQERKESALLTALYVALGVALLGIGVVFAFSPLAPGFVFVLAGLGILSARFAWLAHRLDRLELACRRWVPSRWRKAQRASSAKPGLQLQMKELRVRREAPRTRS